MNKKLEAKMKQEAELSINTVVDSLKEFDQSMQELKTNLDQLETVLKELKELING